MRKKNTILLSFVTFSALSLLLISGCSYQPQTWPDNERNAGNKIVDIQKKIGGGLKSGELTPDQSQNFLTTLKPIQADYSALRDKRVYRDEWDKLFVRLDALDAEINRSLARPARINEPRTEEPRNADRIVALQTKIDDGRNSRRLPATEEHEFQDRLDSIRRDYSRNMEGGRIDSSEESANISRRLDSLEADLNRLR